MIMKILCFAVIVITLSGCSRRDEERTRIQAREAARQMEIDAKKASHEINRDLEKTRDKVHEAIDDRRNTR